jgi:hypothetical protein
MKTRLSIVIRNAKVPIARVPNRFIPQNLRNALRGEDVELKTDCLTV